MLVECCHCARTMRLSRSEREVIVRCPYCRREVLISAADEAAPERETLHGELQTDEHVGIGDEGSRGALAPVPAAAPLVPVGAAAADSPWHAALLYGSSAVAALVVVGMIFAVPSLAAWMRGDQELAGTAIAWRPPREDHRSTGTSTQDLAQLSPMELLRAAALPDVLQIAQIEKTEADRIAAESLERLKQLAAQRKLERDQETRRIETAARLELDRDRLKAEKMLRERELELKQQEGAERDHQARITSLLDSQRGLASREASLRASITALLQQHAAAEARYYQAVAEGTQIGRVLSYVDGVGIPIILDYHAFRRWEYLHGVAAAAQAEGLQLRGAIAAAQSELASHIRQMQTLRQEFELETARGDFKKKM